MRIAQDSNLLACLNGAVGVDDNFFYFFSIVPSLHTLPCRWLPSHASRSNPCTWDVLRAANHHENPRVSGASMSLRGKTRSWATGLGERRAGTGLIEVKGLDRICRQRRQHPQQGVSRHGRHSCDRGGGCGRRGNTFEARGRCIGSQQGQHS
jgi:hypothetical protein